jgi:hypothetical protein
VARRGWNWLKKKNAQTSHAGPYKRPGRCAYCEIQGLYDLEARRSTAPLGRAHNPNGFRRNAVPPSAVTIPSHTCRFREADTYSRPQKGYGTFRCSPVPASNGPALCRPIPGHKGRGPKLRSCKRVPKALIDILPPQGTVVDGRLWHASVAPPKTSGVGATPKKRHQRTAPQNLIGGRAEFLPVG